VCVCGCTIEHVGSTHNRDLVTSTHFDHMIGWCAHGAVEVSLTKPEVQTGVLSLLLVAVAVKCMCLEVWAAKPSEWLPARIMRGQVVPSPALSCLCQVVLVAAARVS
jgi:hypothetical protein